MPTVRFGDEGEGEGLTRGAASATASREVSRVTSNLTLSNHIGQFVAGEVSNRFKAENLADSLKGKNAIHVSFSWG